jgi:hypothetical protein
VEAQRLMIYAKEIKLTRRISILTRDPQRPDHIQVYWDSTATIANGIIESPVQSLPENVIAAYNNFEAAMDYWLAERIKE